MAGAATAAANWGALPLVFGIMAFVYSGHGVFPSIQRSMKEPSRFPQACPREDTWPVCPAATRRHIQQLSSGLWSSPLPAYSACLLSETPVVS